MAPTTERGRHTGRSAAPPLPDLDHGGAGMDEASAIVEDLREQIAEMRRSLAAMKWMSVVTIVLVVCLLVDAFG